jgi:CTP synthase
MKLGSYKTIIEEQSLAHKIYNKTTISERHRHRFEVNPNNISLLESSGLIVSGRDSISKKRADIIEISEHKFFFGCQFHPEYLSRPLKPSPPFLEFLKCAQTV